MLRNKEYVDAEKQGICWCWETRNMLMLIEKHGICWYWKPGGGHWPWKGVCGCAAVMTPFFQATRRSLAYQFTIIVPLLCPPFSNFRKIFNFQPCFGQNFSFQDANFPNFRSLDPSFFKENPLPRPYFWKPVWHTPTKKKVECPPPPGLEISLALYRPIHVYPPRWLTVIFFFYWLADRNRCWGILQNKGINIHSTILACFGPWRWC